MAAVIRAARWAGLLLAGASLGGCATYSSRLTPTPTPEGRYAAGVNVDVIVMDRGVGTHVLPNPEIWLRYGLAEDWDVGARINALGMAVDARWAPLQGELSLAFVPRLGFGFVGATNQDTGLFHLTPSGSALLGYTLGGGRQLVLGLHAHAELRMAAIAFRGDLDGTRWVFVPGATLGVSLPIGDTEYALFPEIGLYAPFDTQPAERLPLVVQGGLGVRLW